MLLARFTDPLNFKALLLTVGCTLACLPLNAEPLSANGLNYSHVAIGHTTQDVTNTQGQANYTGYSFELSYLFNEHFYLLAGYDHTSTGSGSSEDHYRKNKMGLGYRQALSEGTDMLAVVSHSDALFTHFPGTTDFGLRLGLKSVSWVPGFETTTAYHFSSAEMLGQRTWRHGLALGMKYKFTPNLYLGADLNSITNLNRSFINVGMLF